MRINAYISRYWLNMYNNFSNIINLVTIRKFLFQYRIMYIFVYAS